MIGEGSDTDEMDDDLLEGREDEMEGVTAEMDSDELGVFTPLRDA